MRLLVSLIACFLLLAPTANSEASAPGALGLRPEQVPADCKEVDDSFPVDKQTAVLWDKPELSQSAIPIPIAKTAQSFVCEGDKGTVYFFEFGDEAQRKTAAIFVKAFLWGAPVPTADHPELVLESSALLTVVSFRKTPKSLLATLQTLTIPARVSHDASAGTDFEVPGHGNLRLKVPDGWQSKSRQLASPASVTLHFIPAQGDAFDVQVTAVWLDTAKRSTETTDSLKAHVQHSAESLLAHSVEKTVTLHDLRGARSIGFYYTLTDNDPGPGEFANLTQGEFLTGEILSVFTILHRTPVSSEVDAALHAFAEATQTK